MTTTDPARRRDRVALLVGVAEHFAELTGHAVWMWIIELTRRHLRNRITHEPDAEVSVTSAGPLTLRPRSIRSTGRRRLGQCAKCRVPVR
ncbi:MAG TPA: hypothetical protein VGC67_00350 [Cellulomonas sp.]